VVARLLLLAMLVAANALFVVGEYSVVTARRAGLAARAEAGSRRAAAALRLMDDPVRVISTVQVGITAVGILTGAVGEPAVRALLGGGPPRAVSFLIALAVVTYFMVVLGELVPKALSLERAESLAPIVARPLEITGRVLHPVVWVLEHSARLALRPFGVGQVVAGQSIRSAEELRGMVDEAERAGVIPRAQEELLYNVFDFASREARDVMVPAPDVFWLDGGMPPQAALDRVIGGAHTRFPVGDGSLDRLVGVVHAREIAAAARDGAPATIVPLARPAFIVPETKDLGALLRELRDRREQLAVVMSEYGTTAGIVTLEDILEEIVGEIEGEYELPDATMRWLDDRTVLVSGSLTIDDFNETTGTRLPQDGPRTLAGLVFDALGRGSVEGDEVTVAGVGMQVEQVEGARIIRLRVTTPSPARKPTQAP
jgi:putative hemolysin